MALPSLQSHVDDGNFGAGAVAGRRFYDNTTGTWMVKVFPGEFYVSRQSDEVLVTVLGSCVSACIRDPVRGIGGMNHFMLPHDSTGRWGDDQKSTRFGNFAMEQLINELIKAGCVRERMEIKLFGGGNVTDTSNAVGTDNADFVLKYLKDEGLRHAVADLGARARRGHAIRRPAASRAVCLATPTSTRHAGREGSQPIAANAWRH
jgi:chemotaxis protein CheD